MAALLNANAFLRVERPPEVWNPVGEDEPIVRMLGEMIAAALGRAELDRVTLRAANVVVEHAEGSAAPPGEYVARRLRAAGDWGPEATWRPGDRGAPTLVTADLDAAVRAAGVPYAYTRSGDAGSVTVFLP